MRGFAFLAGAALAAMPLAVSAGDTGPSASAPATVTPTADPARLKAAEKTVDLVFPTGTYAKVMQGSLDALLGPAMDSLAPLTAYDLASQTGASVESLQKLDPKVLAEVQAIYDPYLRERTEGGMRAMMGHMTTLMNTMEPDVRQGLKRAYANRFDVKQLDELNTFFATPTGKAYAEQSMLIFLDPEIMQTMQKMMPALIQQMPAMESAAKEVAGKFPAPRKTCDLSKEDLAKVIRLLEIKDFPSNYCDPIPVDYAR